MSMSEWVIGDLESDTRMTAKTNTATSQSPIKPVPLSGGQEWFNLVTNKVAFWNVTNSSWQILPSGVVAETISSTWTFNSGIVTTTESVSNLYVSGTFSANITLGGGGSGDNISSPQTTLVIGGSTTSTTVDINLGKSNTWSASLTSFLGNEALLSATAISGAKLQTSYYEDFLSSYFSGSSIPYGFRIKSVMDSVTPTAHLSINLNNSGSITELFKIDQAANVTIASTGSMNILTPAGTNALNIGGPAQAGGVIEAYRDNLGNPGIYIDPQQGQWYVNMPVTTGTITVRNSANTATFVLNEQLISGTGGTGPPHDGGFITQYAGYSAIQPGTGVPWIVAYQTTHSITNSFYSSSWFNGFQGPANPAWGAYEIDIYIKVNSISNASLQVGLYYLPYSGIPGVVLSDLIVMNSNTATTVASISSIGRYYGHAMVYCDNDFYSGTSLSGSGGINYDMTSYVKFIALGS